MTDRELWQQLRDGREPALEQIYRAHVDALLAYGRMFSPDGGLVEDCVHDLFVELWRNRQGLGDNDSIRPYLLVALRRKIVRKLQRRAKRLDDRSPEEVPFEAGLTVEDRITRSEASREQSRRLQAAFAELSRRQREAIYLKYYHGLDYEEICEVMGLNYQSARNLVFAGLKALRRLLGAWAGWTLLCWKFFV